MPVCNLFGNIYNKAYRSILSIILILNDGRICLIVVPDKNIMACGSKYNLKLHDCFVYFIQTINLWRMVFYFFYFTAPVTELLRI